MITDTAREGETACKPPLVQIIIEQAAYTSRLAPMAQEKVVVTPFFITGIDIVTEIPAGLMGDAVPMPGILLKTVVGRQVKTAAEPPHRIHAFLLGDEEAHVHVRGRDIGIAGMHDQGHAHGLERTVLQFRPVGRGRTGHVVAVHMGKIDAGLLEYPALGEDPRTSAAAGVALPVILHEFRFPVRIFQFGADPVLQVQQVVCYRLCLDFFRHLVRVCVVTCLGCAPHGLTASYPPHDT